jgi:hypothetical protein
MGMEKNPNKEVSSSQRSTGDDAATKPSYSP